MLPDEGRERDRKTEDVVVAEAGEIGRQPGLRAADAEVRQAGQPEAGADRRTLQCSHDRCQRADEARRLDVHLVRSVPGTCVVGGGVGGTAPDVRSRAEVLALGAEQDRTTGRWIGVERLVRVGQRSENVDLEEILWRSVHLHGRDEGVIERHRHIAKAFHVSPPASSAFMRRG